MKFRMKVLEIKDGEASFGNLVRVLPDGTEELVSHEDFMRSGISKKLAATAITFIANHKLPLTERNN